MNLSSFPRDSTVIVQSEGQHYARARACTWVLFVFDRALAEALQASVSVSLQTPSRALAIC